MLSTVGYTFLRPDADLLRRNSISYRVPLAPLATAISMDDYGLTAAQSSNIMGRNSEENLAQSNLRHFTNSTSASSSSRRASLPPFLPPMHAATHSPSYAPSPRSSTFRHRPSISSTASTGTSTSTSISTNDDLLRRSNDAAIRDRELAGMYSGLQSYTFGSGSPASVASATLHPFAAGRQSFHGRASGPISRQSSTVTNAGMYVGPPAGSPMCSSEYDDSDMGNGSDVGSAYSPEDDAFAASLKRWNRSTGSPEDEAVPVNNYERRLSRDSMQAEYTGRPSSQKEDKKRDRKGHRRTNPSTSTMTASRSNQENQEVTTDEESSARVAGRSKMRAIDDGSRRPSLPINMPSGGSSHHPSLAPLTIVADDVTMSGPVLTQDDIRMSICSESTSPSTPTIASFSHPLTTARTSPRRTYPGTNNGAPPPAAATSNPKLFDETSVSSCSSHPSRSSPSTAPSDSSCSTDQHREVKTRPRSRSNRAKKPLPALPPMTGLNPNWVAPWSLEGSQSSTSPSTSLPLGLPPPGTNPFLPSPQGRNPFVKRDSNQTVRQLPSPVSPPSSPPLSSAVPPDPSNPASPTATVTVSVPVAQPIVIDASPIVPPSGDTATADFDLAFILSGAVTDATHAPNVSDVGTYSARKASLAPSVEDTFVRFVNKFDDDYGERRDKWSYQLERSSSSLEGQGEYWRCENMGRYWVGRESGPEEGVGAASAASYDGFTAENSLTMRFCPPEDLSRKETNGSESGHHFSFPASGDGAGMSFLTPSFTANGALLSPALTPSQKRSNVRVQVKKHVRAPAFTLYLGPRGPRSVSVQRPSILLAPKAFQLHNSLPPKGRVMKGKNALSVPSGSSEEPRPATLSPPGRSSMSSRRGPDFGMGPASSSLTTLVSGSVSSASSHAPSRTSASITSEGDLTVAEQRFTGPHDDFPRSSHSPNRQSPPLPHPSTAVSLDFMSVAAATGRMTSTHKQAFDTLSPEDGQIVLEHLKHRTSLGIRLKRAFGGRESSGGSRDLVPMMLMGSSSNALTNGHGDHRHHEGGRDGRSSSPASGKHNKDDNHHGPVEAAFEPPWMLLTPMYVREAVVAAERSMYTGFASLGLTAPQMNKKGGKRGGAPMMDQPAITAAMRRNSVLDTVPNEAMCMVLPLWDLSLDVQEDRRKRHRAMDDLDLDLDDLDEEDEDEDEGLPLSPTAGGSQDIDGLVRAQTMKEMARRRKLMPPPKVERKYLLAYYVPFNAKRQSLAVTPSNIPAATSSETRPSKKRPQHTSQNSSRASAKRRNSGAGQPPSSSATTSKAHSVRSFRVVSRILTAAELRDSGLSPPRNIVDPKRMQQQSTTFYHSSLNYQRMDRRLSSASILGDIVPSSFSAVIAVCHDRRRGVEFVPEGLDSLGLCGDGTVMGSNGSIERLPPLFPAAHMVPVSERITPPLNAVGKQVVEMIWAGCLALTELGI